MRRRGGCGGRIDLWEVFLPSAEQDAGQFEEGIAERQFLGLAASQGVLVGSLHVRIAIQRYDCSHVEVFSHAPIAHLGQGDFGQGGAALLDLGRQTDVGQGLFIRREAAGILNEGGKRGGRGQAHPGDRLQDMTT